MTELKDILDGARDALERGVAQSLADSHDTAWLETVGGGLPFLMDALIAEPGEERDEAASRWGAAAAEEAQRRGAGSSQILGFLKQIEDALRVEVIREISNKRELLDVLGSLADAMQTLRLEAVGTGPPDPRGFRAENFEFVGLAEHSADFICLANLHGKPFYLNKRLRKLLGLGDDDKIPSSSLYDYCTEESWAELRDIGVPAVNRSGRWEGRSRLRDRQSGRVIDVSTTMFIIQPRRAELSRCLAIVHRQADAEIEEALAESEARKHAIIESSLDPIITIDHEGVITEYNRAAEQVFGHPREKVLGHPPSEILFPPAKIAGHQNRIDRYLNAGEGSLLGKRVEVTAVRASGETFPAEMAMVISRQHGLPVLTFFVRDISHRKRAEEDQARYAAELERSNRELEQFAYVASHDLQEPLRKIRTFGDRLEMKCGEALDETGRECLERMQNAAGRMQTLINDLLSLSRVTTRGQEFAPVDLKRIVDEVVGDLEVKIEQTEARVEVGKLPTIQADPVQMRQLFQNLIGNALKFHRDEEPPVVKIEGRFVHGREGRRVGRAAADEQCRITVRDNGTSSESSPSFSGCIRGRCMRGPAWGWRCVRKSCSATADRSPPKALPAKARRLSSSCRPPIRKSGADRWTPSIDRSRFSWSTTTPKTASWPKTPWPRRGSATGSISSATARNFSTISTAGALMKTANVRHAPT
jgi:two-component system sensor kinase FixL